MISSVILKVLFIFFHALSKVVASNAVEASSKMDGSGFLQRIFGSEINAILPFISLMGLVGLTLLVLSAWAMFRLLRWAIEGKTPERGSGGKRHIRLIVGQTLLIVPCLIVLERFFLRRMPTLAFLALTILLGAVLFRLGKMFPQALRALFLVFTRRVKPGDVVQVAGFHGEILHMDLFRVELRADDGRRAHLPLHMLGQEIVILSSPEQSYPVEFLMPQDGEKLRKDLEVRAFFCPYRDTASPVNVQQTLEGKTLIRFQAWSEAAAKESEAYLQHALAERAGREKNGDAPFPAPQE